MARLVIAALYQFVPLVDPAALAIRLKSLGRQFGLKGTLLLATEGINGTIAGSPLAVDAVIAALRAWSGVDDGLSLKLAFDHSPPFHRFKVQVKAEIVTMGLPGLDIGATRGTYVEPGDWNRLINDPSVIVIDTRNDYEVSIGSFAGAENPGLNSFRSFPTWLENRLASGSVDRVAMFCTGGIRCEKATAWARHLGVRDVYHLKGGILKYLEDTPEEHSLWRGECFVFDERVSVGHRLEKGAYTLCRGCRRPVGPAERASSQYEEGVSCPHCHNETSPVQKARFAERRRQVELAESKSDRHIGMSQSQAHHTPEKS